RGEAEPRGARNPPRAAGHDRRRALPRRPHGLARERRPGDPDRVRGRGRGAASPAGGGRARGRAPERRAPAQRPVSARRAAALLLAPCLLVLLFLFVRPQGLMSLVSSGRRSVYGGVLPGGGLANYARALEPLYMDILLRSVVLAGATTLLCLLAG